MRAPGKNTVCGGENCPEDVRAIVNGIVDFCRQVLGGNLVGFYLHGSLAMGCFNPQSSDIDFLVVVRGKLTIEEKKSVIRYLIDISSRSSSLPPEMSIVTLRNVTNVVYPTPFELHYSSSWRDLYLNENVDWNAERCDEDLVLHYLAVRARGICLYGQPIALVFPAISREMCISSLLRDLDWMVERLASIPPTYIVLNPCRALAFLRTGTFMSKKEGGVWALLNLPKEFSGVISTALAWYVGGEARVLEQHEVLGLIAYTRKEISGETVRRALHR